jgi:hypothetical protein
VGAKVGTVVGGKDTVGAKEGATDSLLLNYEAQGKQVNIISIICIS